jgi:hypothetical protein
MYGDMKVFYFFKNVEGLDHKMIFFFFNKKINKIKG